MQAATYIWMFLVLKIPIVAALWLIWWAIQEPEPVVDEEGEPGGSDRRERAPLPPGPRSPRRGGPHGAPPPAPARVRTNAAGRRTSRS